MKKLLKITIVAIVFIVLIHIMLETLAK